MGFGFSERKPEFPIPNPFKYIFTGKEFLELKNKGRGEISIQKNTTFKKQPSSHITPIPTAAFSSNCSFCESLISLISLFDFIIS